MQALLSLLTALAWGSGNFAMGIASKNHSPRPVVLAGFLAGLVGALFYIVLSQPTWNLDTFAWGAASGVAQGVGWGLLSYAMRVGRVAIVAPIAATGTSAFVFLAGLISGDPIHATALIGAVIVLLSLTMLTGTKKEEVDAFSGGGHSARKGSFIALAVAACFAMQSICLNQVADGEPSVVMFGARIAIVVLIGTALLLRPERQQYQHRYLVPAAIGGAFLLGGDIVYLAALNSGPLSVAGVLAGANPAVTVVLAVLILKERLGRERLAGVLLGLCGAALLALG